MDEFPAIRVNVADRLAESARREPERLALVEAWGRERRVTLAQLDRDADLLARGLIELGVRPGMRLALLVKPGIDFVTLVFALLRSGAAMVLVDGALGRENIVRCLAATEPEGFVAIGIGHVLRIAKRREFPRARLNVMVGSRWGWGGTTLAKLRQLGERTGRVDLPVTHGDDPAAIVFTSGSTGPPKGVEYRHETFVTQLTEIERMYGLAPGGIDLACFPLFGLFNVALGITTVLPEMDFSRPASADPAKLVAAANKWRVTQSFASPAVWDRLSTYCETTGTTIPTLREVFSCGAPVPAEVIRQTLVCVAPDARLHTPYGATESLPVSTIEAAELLGGTDEATAQGRGVCVGRRALSIDWRVIEITDEAIKTIDEARELPQGEIGELVVRGPQVSRRYLTSPWMTVDPNALSKIADGEHLWHRLGDVGYFDAEGRFWYCGRKSQRVVTSAGMLFTEQVEGIANSHPAVKRSALVGVEGAPIVVVELRDNASAAGIQAQVLALLHEHDVSRQVTSVLVHPKLPTDIRHNAKIQRERLAEWAATSPSQ